MWKPDAKLHNPDPAYLLQLLEKAGVSQCYASSRMAS